MNKIRRGASWIFRRKFLSHPTAPRSTLRCRGSRSHRGANDDLTCHRASGSSRCNSPASTLPALHCRPQGATAHKSRSPDARSSARARRDLGRFRAGLTVGRPKCPIAGPIDPFRPRPTAAGRRSSRSGAAPSFGHEISIRSGSRTAARPACGRRSAGGVERAEHAHPGGGWIGQVGDPVERFGPQDPPRRRRGIGRTPPPPPRSRRGPAPAGPPKPSPSVGVISAQNAAISPEVGESPDGRSAARPGPVDHLSPRHIGGVQMLGRDDAFGQIIDLAEPLGAGLTARSPDRQRYSSAVFDGCQSHHPV